MLTALSVRHFAVVEAINIELGPGLAVVTGETGAGKSLLVDALLLLSGARADSGMIRAGCERAELSASFDLTHLPAARDWLQEAAMDEDGACQLRRVLKAEGSSRAWINGRPATLAQLSELAPLLVEIHGQHEHQALLSRPHQLSLLDAFADVDDTLDQVRAQARQWRELGVRQKALAGSDDPAARIELLRHELTDLERWALPPDALAELNNDHKRLANAGRLLDGSRGVDELLDGDGDYTVKRLLGRARAELEPLAELDPRLAPITELLGNADIQIEEAEQTLSRFAQDLDLDPDRYAELDTHLGHLHELSRRHRTPVENLQAQADTLRTELDELENSGATLAKLATERTRLAADYARAADTLSKARRKAGKQLGEKVSVLMQELGMAGGSFEVELTAQVGADPDPQGRERCEFLVSANPGQPPRALRKVASGGELARISLAIEVAALGLDTVGSMVFDEVDAGIGGAVAEVVGQKLRALGEHRQVLCVTHLPQVAAQGHTHLKVEKRNDGDTTVTTLASLNTTQRHEELARMLGGIDITRETRVHARKMLEQAQK
ncbi:MAG TPA: DNA repair protein RecN [Rhodanobacteraceae bacterium]